MTSVTVLGKRTYQRDIPIVICSFLIAVLLTHHFIAADPLEDLRSSILSWANIITLLVWSFAIIGMIIGQIRRLAYTDRWNRERYRSVVVLAALLFFLLLGLTDPALDQGPTFSLLYMMILGRITFGTGAVLLTHFSYNVWRRITQSYLTPEIIVFILIYVFSLIRRAALITEAVPFFATTGNWIEKVPYATGMRALTIITAIGTLIVATRALVGREPGMIEMEVT